jgi:O-antigen/teichoic acid export membrane protein
MGLKRGLAKQLTDSKRDHAHEVWDALIVCVLASLVIGGFLIAVPELMFPNSALNGLDRLLPLVVILIASADVALSALAYRLDVAATVRARSVVEPWTLGIAAFALAFVTKRDGLIISYVLSMIAAFFASMIPLIRSYGWPRLWRPRLDLLVGIARQNTPLAAADAIEWASRRIDVAMLGLFLPPAAVAVYWMAQQIASIPQKLKTSFDSILAPVISQNLTAGNTGAVAQQVSQVGFWIIGAQLGTALMIGIPGEAVMGVIGPNFVAGTGALALLLAAEFMAATAAVSESALVYVARGRNAMVSLFVIGIEAMLCFALLYGAREIRLPGFFSGDGRLPLYYQAAAPALGLLLALGLGSILKARLLSRLLNAPVTGWRWALVWAALVGSVVGWAATEYLPEWAELAVGIPAIAGSYLATLWYFGFGTDDRELFRLKRRGPSPIVVGDLNAESVASR